MKAKELSQGANASFGDELVASLTEGVAILRGELPPARFHPAPITVNVRAIRKQFGLTQSEFARQFGFGLATVRDWEQGRYQPDQAARSYLLVIEREPEVVPRALQAAAA